MSKKNRTFEIGDKVVYSVEFCRSCSLAASNDPLAHRNFGAVVTHVMGWASGQLVTVTDANGDTRKVASWNLEKV